MSFCFTLLNQILKRDIFRHHTIRITMSPLKKLVEHAPISAA